MKAQHKAAIALAVVVIEISLWSIFLQIGGSQIGILPELFYGFLVGSAVSVAISLARDRGAGLMAIARKPNMLVVMLAAGLLNDLLTQMFLGVGTLGTNPAIGSIVFRSWVIIAALLTPFVLRQKVGSKQLFATLIGFLGIYLILSGGTLFSFSPAQAPDIGILLLAAFCSALSILIMNKYNVDTAGAIAIFNISSFIVVSALIIATHTSIVVPFTPMAILSVLFLGSIAYGIGTMLFYYSVKTMGSLITGNSILLVPFLTIVFSFLIMGTPIKAYYVLAAAFIGLGVVLQRRYSLLPERITRKGVLSRMHIFDVTGIFAGNSGYEIRNQIAGNGRAFAINLGDSRLSAESYYPIFSKNRCIAFTNVNPHSAVKPEEVDSINDAMDLREGSIAVIGIGDPQNLELSFEELANALD